MSRPIYRRIVFLPDRGLPSRVSGERTGCTEAGSILNAGWMALINAILVKRHENILRPVIVSLCEQRTSSSSETSRLRLYTGKLKVANRSDQIRRDTVRIDSKTGSLVYARSVWRLVRPLRTTGMPFLHLWSSVSKRYVAIRSGSVSP